MNDPENDVPSPPPPEDAAPTPAKSSRPVAIIGGGNTARLRAALAAQAAILSINVEPQTQPDKRKDAVVLDSLGMLPPHLYESVRMYPATARRGKNTYQKKKLEALRNGKYRKKDWS